MPSCLEDDKVRQRLRSLLRGEHTKVRSRYSSLLPTFYLAHPLAVVAQVPKLKVSLSNCAEGCIMR